MSNFLGGPTSPDTRCLICRTRKGPGYVWTHIGGTGTYPPFAGYFCGKGCAATWDGESEEKHLERIFGDVHTGLELLEAIEDGRYVLDTEADPEGVMEFVQLNTTESVVYAVEPQGEEALPAPIFQLDAEGRPRRTGRVARHRFTGLRAPRTIGTGHVKW